MAFDLTFDVVYATVMAMLGGANIWRVYRGYRRCMKHLEDRESPAVLRQDIANITFDAMSASALCVIAGMSIAGIDAERVREHRWFEVALLICVWTFICILSVRPFRQVVHRLPDGPQVS